MYARSKEGRDNRSEWFGQRLKRVRLSCGTNETGCWHGASPVTTRCLESYYAQLSNDFNSDSPRVRELTCCSETTACPVFAAGAV